MCIAIFNAVVRSDNGFCGYIFACFISAIITFFSNIESVITNLSVNLFCKVMFLKTSCSSCVCSFTEFTIFATLESCQVVFFVIMLVSCIVELKIEIIITRVQSVNIIVKAVACMSITCIDCTASLAN